MISKIFHSLELCCPGDRKAELRILLLFLSLFAEETLIDRAPILFLRIPTTEAFLSYN